jgi:hypothetical protein
MLFPLGARMSVFFAPVLSVRTRGSIEADRERGRSLLDVREMERRISSFSSGGMDPDGRRAGKGASEEGRARVSLGLRGFLVDGSSYGRPKTLRWNDRQSSDWVGRKLSAELLVNLLFADDSVPEPIEHLAHPACRHAELGYRLPDPQSVKQELKCFLWLRLGRYRRFFIPPPFALLGWRRGMWEVN